MRDYHRAILATGIRTLDPVYRWRFLFNSGAGVAAWAFLIFGLVLVRFICVNSDLSGLTTFRNAPSTLSSVAEEPSEATGTTDQQNQILLATGKVISSNDTGTSVNERRIFSVRFQFEDASGRLYEGTSYKYEEGPAKDTSVTVEYVESNPAVARIQGMRMKHIGPYGWLFAIVPLVAFLLLLLHFMNRLRKLQTLQYGELVFGDLAEKHNTNTTINGRPVCEYIYEYQTDDGRTMETTIKTHRSLGEEDGGAIPLVVDSRNPDDAIALELLPGHPYIDDQGVLRPKSRNPMGIIFAPVLTILLVLSIIAQLMG